MIKQQHHQVKIIDVHVNRINHKQNDNGPVEDMLHVQTHLFHWKWPLVRPYPVKLTLKYKQDTEKTLRLHVSKPGVSYSGISVFTLLLQLWEKQAKVNRKQQHCLVKYLTYMHG